MFYLELVCGLRKGELVALLWNDLDIDHKTISFSKQYVRNPSGEVMLFRPKMETSVRQISIPQDAVNLLVQEHNKYPENQYMFPSPVTGEMSHPDSVVKLHKKILKDAGLEHIRFHDLRHPYVKHKTKIRQVSGRRKRCGILWRRSCRDRKSNKKARQESRTSCLALFCPSPDISSCGSSLKTTSPMQKLIRNKQGNTLHMSFSLIKLHTAMC